MSYFHEDKLSIRTIQAYTSRIQSWLTIHPNISLEFIILFPKHALQLLIQHLTLREKQEQKTICTPTNLHQYVSAILAILRYSPHVVPDLPDRIEYYQTWTQLLNQIDKPIKERRMKQLPTIKQSERGGSSLKYHDLIYKRDHGNLSMYHHLLLSFYTYLYPVRADYYATEIVDETTVPTSPNYIRLHQGSAELVLTNFKTAKVFKQIHYPNIPNELYHILLQSLKTSPRKYVFESNGKPFTRHRFSEWASSALADIFGTEINLTMIRHLFISTISMELPVSELKKIGDLMGHSFTQQKLYKWNATESGSDSSDTEL
jgi:hypothetical protein